MSFLYKIKTQKLFPRLFLLFVFLEIFSFLAYKYNFIALGFLALVFLLTLFFGFYKKEYLLYIPLAELFWGSLGHSFQYDFISLRLVIFVAVLSAFAISNIKYIGAIKVSKDKPVFYIWLLLITFWLLAVFLAYTNNYGLSNIFLDSNAYLYVFYLPVWYQVYEPKQLETIFEILKAAATLVAIKTILVFNLFVQNYNFINLDLLYKWIRDTRTGEITPMENNFYRVFFQSHFYLLVSWFALLIAQMRDFKNKIIFFILGIVSVALLLSLSRSLWLGAMFGILFLFINIFRYGRKMILPLILFCFSLLVFSIISIEIFYNLPKFNTLNIFYQRSVSTQEAAANSRLELLSPLWQEIKERPFFGWGFAKEITYKSADPRIKNEENPDGWHSTYALEWGWLDMWLKAGIFFIFTFMAWLSLIFIRAYNVFEGNKSIVLALLSALTAMFFIHIFSPYINHPLGLGLIMLSTVIFSLYAKKDQSYN